MWVALAIALELVVAAALLFRLRRMVDSEDSAVPRRGAKGLWTIPLLVALVPLIVAGAVHAAPRPAGSPVATVKGFLSSAVVDNDGVTACTYLTAGARAGIERGGATCETFFGGASLRRVSSDHDLAKLRYVVSGRVVTVDGVRFVLRRANAVELQESHAPDTSWRIASPPLALGSRVAGRTW
jgi:hypothetical protein